MNDNDEVDKLEFKNYPVTLGEARSDRSQSAHDWVPRDVLIDILRQIDNGANISSIVVCYRQEDRVHYKASVITEGDALALLARATWLVNESM